MCKITPFRPAGEEKVDWAGWLEERKLVLRDMPIIEGSAMDADREGYRW